MKQSKQSRSHLKENRTDVHAITDSHKHHSKARTNILPGAGKKQEANIFEKLSELDEDSDDGSESLHDTVTKLKSAAEECIERLDYPGAINLYSKTIRLCRREGKSEILASCLMLRGTCWFFRSKNEKNQRLYENYLNNSYGDYLSALKLNQNSLNIYAGLVKVAKEWKKRTTYKSVLKLLENALVRSPINKELHQFRRDLLADMLSNSDPSGKSDEQESDQQSLNCLFKIFQPVQLLDNTKRLSKGSNAFVSEFAKFNLIKISAPQGDKLVDEIVSLDIIKRLFFVGDFVSVKINDSYEEGRICDLKHQKEGEYSILMRESNKILKAHVDNIIWSFHDVNHDVNFEKYRDSSDPMVGDEVIFFGGRTAIVLSVLINHQLYLVRYLDNYSPMNIQIAWFNHFWIPFLEKVEKVKDDNIDSCQKVTKKLQKKGKKASNASEPTKDHGPENHDESSTSKSVDEYKEINVKMEIISEEEDLQNLINSFANADSTMLNNWRDENSRFSAVDKVVASSHCSIDKKKLLLNELLSKGADLNLQHCTTKETSLHLAAKANDSELLLFLLDKGALPNILNFKSQLPENCSTEAHIIDLLKTARIERKALKVKLKAREKKSKSKISKSDRTNADETAEATAVEPVIAAEQPDENTPVSIVEEEVCEVCLPDLVNQIVSSLSERLSLPVLSGEQSQNEITKVIDEGSISIEKSTDSIHEISDAVNDEFFSDIPPQPMESTSSQPSETMMVNMLSNDNDSNENSLWEIEITKEARQQWFSLDKMLRRMVALKLTELARGHWSAKMKRTTSHIKGIQLFRANFAKGGRIMWEKAISYSAKQKSYIEVIRVWSIVADHDKQNESIARIEESHRKGMASNVVKKLKFRYVNKSLPDSTASDVKDEDGIVLIVPRQFDVVSENNQESEPTNATQEVSRDFLIWYPPAVPSADAYVLLKFYECTKGLINLYCAELEEKENTDFPFRLSPTEQEICDLQASPPCSTLLLGRSGTGKTTCLGFRIWSHYKAWHSLYAPLNSALATSSRGDEVHLNQVFLTANPVLRTEVCKFFKALLRGDGGESTAPVSQSRLECGVDYPTLTGVPSSAFPLFLTKREWLVLIDGTLERPFFERVGHRCELSPLASKHAWGRTETSGLFNLLESLEDDEDENEYLDDDYGNADTSYDRHGPPTGVSKNHIEIDFEYFSSNIWPHLDDHAEFSPSLLWCEFTSFIKGSLESLETGQLTLSQYEKVGMKRARNFRGCRSKVYANYLQYEKLKRQVGGYDLCDLIYHIFNELRRQAQAGNGPLHSGYFGSPLHELFVDEVQDFLESEIMLMAAVADPNQLFLTGDDAQTIARGLSFRFCDVASIFWKLQQQDPTVGVPVIRTLTNNYRTHSGILNLANTIIEIMGKLFPGSVEQIPHDRGLFDGPKPWILKAAKFEDLCLLLLGADADTQIEFGAQQCVIVRDAEAKRKIPDELRRGGIVCSVFESKGLEFNDVLLYNFFTDSPAKHYWRCVLGLIEALPKFTSSVDTEAGTGIKAVDFDALKKDKNASFLRSLDFKETQHKILLEELRHLYTAITRARVNIWIYDESEEFRAPMFKLFEMKELVRSVVSILDLDELKISKGALTSQAEWIAQGKNLFEKGAFQLAYTCFCKGRDEKLSRIAMANFLARSHPPEGESTQDRIKRFDKAAKNFLLGRDEGSMEGLAEAAWCLRKSENFELAANLYRLLGNKKKAAICLENKEDFYGAFELYLAIGHISQAIRCLEAATKSSLSQGLLLLEQKGLFNEAISILKQKKLFAKAYKLLEKCDPNQMKPQMSLTTYREELDTLAALEARECILRADQEREQESIDSSRSWLREVSPSSYERVYRLLRDDPKLLDLLFFFMLWNGKYIDLASFCAEKRLFRKTAETIKVYFEESGKEIPADLLKLISRCLLSCRDNNSASFEEAESSMRSSGNIDMAELIAVEAVKVMEASDPSTHRQILQILKKQLSYFMQKERPWGVFWVFKTAAEIFSTNFISLLFPTDSFKNFELMNQALEMIIRMIYSCIGGKYRRETEEFFEFSRSMLRPGYIRFDRLAQRLQWIVKGSDITSEVESPGSNFYLAASEENLQSIASFKICKTLWAWDLNSYISAIVVTGQKDKRVGLPALRTMDKFINNLIASVVTLKGTEKAFLKVNDTINSVKLMVAPLFARQVVNLISAYNTEIDSVIPFRDGSFLLPSNWSTILEPFVNSGGLITMYDIHASQTLTELAALTRNASLFTELILSKGRNKNFVSNLFPTAKAVSPHLSPLLSLTATLTPLMSSAVKRKNHNMSITSTVDNLELIERDLSDAGDSEWKVFVSLPILVSVLEECAVVSLSHLAAYFQFPVTLTVSAACRFIATPRVWYSKTNPKDRDMSIFECIQRPNQILPCLLQPFIRDDKNTHFFLSELLALSSGKRQLDPQLQENALETTCKVIERVILQCIHLLRDIVSNYTVEDEVKHSLTVTSSRLLKLCFLLAVNCISLELSSRSPSANVANFRRKFNDLCSYISLHARDLVLELNEESLIPWQFDFISGRLDDLLTSDTMRESDSFAHALRNYKRAELIPELNSRLAEVFVGRECLVVFDSRRRSLRRFADSKDDSQQQQRKSVAHAVSSNYASGGDANNPKQHVVEEGEELEELEEQDEQSLIIIQRHVRGFLCRRRMRVSSAALAVDSSASAAHQYHSQGKGASDKVVLLNGHPFEYHFNARWRNLLSSLCQSAGVPLTLANSLQPIENHLFMHINSLDPPIEPFYHAATTPEQRYVGLMQWANSAAYTAAEICFFQQTTLSALKTQATMYSEDARTQFDATFSRLCFESIRLCQDFIDSIDEAIRELYGCLQQRGFRYCMHWQQSVEAFNPAWINNAKHTMARAQEQFSCAALAFESYHSQGNWTTVKGRGSRGAASAADEDAERRRQSAGEGEDEDDDDEDDNFAPVRISRKGGKARGAQSHSNRSKAGGGGGGDNGRRLRYRSDHPDGRGDGRGEGRSGGRGGGKGGGRGDEMGGGRGRGRERGRGGRGGGEGKAAEYQKNIKK